MGFECFGRAPPGTTYASLPGEMDKTDKGMDNSVHFE